VSDLVQLVPVDNDFAWACRRAAGILKSKESRLARLKETSDLVAILLAADREIGMGERQYLADLLAGELDRPHARPGLTASQKEARRDQKWMVRQYQQELAAQGRKISVADAVQELADKGRLPTEDIETIINDMGRSRQRKG